MSTRVFFMEKYKTLMHRIFYLLSTHNTGFYGEIQNYNAQSFWGQNSLLSEFTL